MRAFGRACWRRRPARPCCEARLIAAFALAAGGVLHGVALVEDDDTPSKSAPNHSTICSHARKPSRRARRMRSVA